jgi:hypothetical protein
MEDTLTVPNPLKGLSPLRYDMRLAYAAESRLEEIATVTPARGQELMALFNRACFSLSRTYSDLQLQFGLVKDRLNKRKAVMLVDEIPPKIKSKGLQDNVMTRQAFLDLDEEYNAASLVLNTIEAYILFIEKQLKATEGALSSLKKIYDATNGTYHRPNPNLPQTLNSIPPLVEEEVSAVENPATKFSKSKYAKPKYGYNSDD